MPRALAFHRGAAIAVAMLVLPFFWSQTAIFTFRLPQTGATVSANGAGYSIAVVAPHSPAANAGLRPGDVVRSAESGIGPGDVLFSGEPMPRVRLRSVDLPVTRNGVSRTVTVHPQSAPYPLRDRLRITARLLSFTAFVLLALWVVLVRPNAMTWLLFGFCIGTIAPTGDVRDVFDIVFGVGSVPDSVLSAIAAMIQRLGLVCIPLFALRFPNDEARGWRARLWAPALWLLSLYTLATWLDSTFWWTESVDDLIGWIDIALQLSAIAILGATFLRSTGMDKLRLKWGFAGVAVGVTCSLCNEFARVISHHSETGITVGAAFTVAAVVMPASLAYAIVRHEIIDIRFVLNRTTVYATVFAAFAGLFALLDWLFTTFVHTSQAAEAIAMAAAFALGFVFRSSRDALIAGVDRLLFPRHHSNMMLLRSLRLALERDADPQNVRNTLTSQATAALNLSSAALFSRCEDGGFVREAAIGWAPDMVWHLFPEDDLVLAMRRNAGKPVRTGDALWHQVDVPQGAARPVLAVPIALRKRSIGFVLYGEHGNRTDIDPDEVAALSDLCAAAAPMLAEGHYPAPSVFATAAVRAAP